jgi:flagellar hook-associated protein 3 FlgL
MTTRLATATIYDTSIDALMQRQRELSESQLQLTSGKRVNRASDDPAAVARAERALARSQRGEANLRAVESSRTNMTQTESSLGDATELLQQVREALVSAGNPTYSDAERASLGDKIAAMRTQLLQLANGSDGAQRFLFGGQGASQPPFIDAPGGVQFRGTAGELAAGGEPGMALSMDGRAVWMSARTGNGVFETKASTSTGTAWVDAGQVTDPSALTGASYSVQFSVSGGTTTYSVLKNGAATALSNLAYTSGSAIEIDGIAVTIQGQPANGDVFDAVPSTPTLSAFDVLDRAAQALKTPLRSATQITQSTTDDLRNLDAVLGQVQSARSGAGEALNRIEGVSERLANANLQAQTERSDAESLDMVQAISAFQTRQTGYDAALKSYSMVQRLSLFQYINS